MEKIKPKIIIWIESEKGKDILTVLIVILVGLGSFGLGRLSKGSTEGQFKVLYPSQSAQNAFSEVNLDNTAQTSKIGVSSDLASSSTSKSSGNFFASKRGHKYYPVDCSAGKTIKQENRVYFETREEAEKAGFTLSSSCQ